MNAQAARVYARKVAPERSVKPSLTVVSSQSPRVAGRFMLTSVVAAGILLVMSVLGITSFTSHLAMESQPLNTELNILREQNQALQEKLEERSSSEWLAKRAAEQGLVPYADYGYVNLKTGEISGGSAAR
ncbi:hypothetical protein KRX54_05265 [Actinomycetaceae bacterium TAE3-ERU4]|nr:hypothetical protein [Actinomycetaceae bacterium TAE3-ERU4]